LTINPPNMVGNHNVRIPKMNIDYNQKKIENKCFSTRTNQTEIFDDELKIE
jgi:hypothetical protein